MPIYNTSIALAAGTGLLLLVALGYQLAGGRSIHRPAWAVAFAALGAILAFLGGVMTVTWPLEGAVAFDNITFGEPALAMGVVLLAGGWLLGAGRYWREAGPTAVPDGAGPDELTAESWPKLAKLLLPLSVFAFAMGLAMIAIAFIGPVYAPWEAPPAEPISSEFSGTPWVENAFISGIYALIGLGALLTPLALAKKTVEHARGVFKVIGVFWLIAGIALVIFGAMNFYTHSGLEINEFNQQQSAQEAGG